MTWDELLEAFTTEKDDKVKAAVVKELGKGNDRLALTVLAIALKEDSEPVKIAAVTALDHNKTKEGADLLWSLVNNPAEGPKLRFAATMSLAKVGDVRAMESLVKAMPKAEALTALLAFGQNAIPVLIESLRSSETRAGAATALIALGPLAVNPLIEVIRNEKTRNARLIALKVLSEIQDESAAAVIDETLKEPGPEFTLAAYRYLIRAGLPASQSRLVSALMSVGNDEMAQDFVTSGNPALKTAAEEWALKRGTLATMRMSGSAPVFWGGVDPSIKEVAVFHFDGSLSSNGINAVESKSVSFVPGKWGQAVSVGKGGTLKYPLANILRFDTGSIEMWISPKVDGDDPVFKKYNHALLLYDSPSGDQFLVSGSTLGGFYCGSVVGHKFAGAGGGSITDWKSGIWHHIAFTYSASLSRQRFYLDGAMISETKGAMPAPKAGRNVFTVACDPYSNWTNFDVDELVLSTGEKGADWILRDASRKSPN
ncbi:MAG: HEAT repeat domain-containing protein [Candidatus Solibacter sp.]